MSERKQLDIKEFRELGLLQEVNRQFFHPLGLALQLGIKEDGEYYLHGIWDCREDPEGILFSDLETEGTAQKKYESYRKLLDDKAVYRLQKFGWITQPIGDKREEE